MDSYIFAHAAEAKRTLSHLGMHGAVVRGTFCFWRMNPLAGIGVSIARNCSETQIFGENCRKHRAKRSFWKHGSVKFEGGLARNARFGSSFCEIWRKHRAKRSFWKLFLWKLSEASRETLVLEARSVKIGGSIARNARFGSFCSTGVVRSSILEGRRSDVVSEVGVVLCSTE